MTPQEEMKQNANDTIQELNDKLQEAMDIVTRYYNEYGSVNGMSYKHETVKINDKLKEAQDIYYKLWCKLEEVRGQMGKINKRVTNHIDDMPDEEEFNQMKLHKTEKPKEETPSIDDVLSVHRLGK